MNYFNKFCEELNARDCYYTCTVNDNGENRINIGLCGDYFPGLMFYIDFDDDSAEIHCENVCEFTPEREQNVMEGLNALNSRYRWIKFSTDGERKVRVTMDIETIEENSTEVLARALYKMNDMIDLLYPTIMGMLQD